MLFVLSGWRFSWYSLNLCNCVLIAFARWGKSKFGICPEVIPAFHPCPKDTLGMAMRIQNIVTCPAGWLQTEKASPTLPCWGKICDYFVSNPQSSSSWEDPGWILGKGSSPHGPLTDSSGKFGIGLSSCNGSASNSSSCPILYLFGDLTENPQHQCSPPRLINQRDVSAATPCTGIIHIKI